MSKIDELERKFYAKGSQILAEEILELAKHYLQVFKKKNNQSKLQSSKEYKKYKEPRDKAVFFAIAAYKKGARQKEQLEIIKKILSKYKHSSSHNIYLNRVIADLLEMQGFVEPKILKKVRGEGWVESGTLYLRDIKFDEEIEGKINDAGLDFGKADSQLIKEAKCIVGSTGGDGLMGLQIRLVEGEFPTITKKEYKVCVGSTQVLRLNVPSGKVRFSDFGMDGVDINITKGTYKCAIYIIDIQDKFFGYYAVICKSDSSEENPDTGILNIEAGN